MSDPQKPKEGQDATVNKIAKISIDEAFATIDLLKTQNDAKDRTILDLTAQLDQMNGVVEAQKKAEIIKDIMVKSNYKLHEVVGLSLDELKTTQSNVNHAVSTGYASVRRGADKLSDRERGLTIGDCSVVTQKQRGAQ
jgi:DNA-directed RNA polymerase beta' subunit